MPDGIIGRIKKIFVRDALNEWLKRIPGRICFMDVFHIVFPSECPKCPEAIKKIRKVLAEEYGGTTEWDGYGCWINPRGETECEPVKYIMSAHRCTDREKAKKIAEAIAEAAETAEQEAVFVGGGGNFFIIGTREMVESLQKGYTPYGKWKKSTWTF